MQSFQRAQSKIFKRSQRAKGLLMLFDFDGTLSPIVDFPSQAILPRHWRNRLKRLSRLPNITVGMVTGRALEDIRKRAGIPGIIYAAAHGYEITRGHRQLLKVGTAHRRPLKKLAGQLSEELSKISGTEVEFKGHAVAVHYRRVKAPRRAAVIRKAKKIALPHLDKQGWQITGGKMVLEVRPAKQWNKGDAVKWIWKHVAPSFLPCYIGDDVTDEDAFRIIGNRGITIRVGRKRNSHAQYYVNNIEELVPWMKEIETRD
jgi:trehalose-phosphatase